MDVPVSNELSQYSTVFLLLGMAVLAVLGMLLVMRLLAPSSPSAVKQMTYECGEVPLGSAWLRFNVRFYMVALIFVLFDVELALIYPVAAILRQTANAPGGVGAGLIVFGEMIFFVGVLLLGLIYVWRKGDLGWIKTFRTSTDHGMRSWESSTEAKG